MSFLVIDTDKHSVEAIDRIRAAMADEGIVEEKDPQVLTQEHELYPSIYRALNAKSDVLDPNCDSQLTLDAMLPVGKSISIGLTITNTDRAQMLFSTMYGRYQDLFGVAVYSWGSFDIQKAQERRITLMKGIHDEYYQKLLELEQLDDRQLAT